MKTSSKILIITGCLFLLLTIAIIAVTAVSFVQSDPPLITTTNGSGELVNKEYALKNFTSLKLEGSCKVTIARSDSFFISLQAPDYMTNYIQLDVADDTLRIKQEYFSFPVSSRAVLSIKMPGLTGIFSRGGNEIYFSGFHEDRMSIESTGFNKIDGRKSTIEQVKLSASHFSAYDLGDCNVVNAHIDFADVARAILHITGGDMEGRISGNSSISYTGNVRMKNIDILDDAKIIKRD